MSETTGRAEQIVQKEQGELRWAQIEQQMATWSDQVGRQIERMPQVEHEREQVRQRVMEYER